MQWILAGCSLGEYFSLIIKRAFETRRIKATAMSSSSLTLQRRLARILARGGIAKTCADREAAIILRHSARNDAERLATLRAETRMPLQYVLGEWDFHRLIGIMCRPPCLCPRPETEELVELVIEKTEQAFDGSQPERLLDIGTGTGAIAISLLKHWPETKCVAIDPNPDACELALDNAAKFGVDARLDIRNCDAADFFAAPDSCGGISLIVSNPPYLKSCEMLDLDPELLHEDPRALDGGTDGADIVRTILDGVQASKRRCPVYMEVHPDHPQLLADEGRPPVSVHRDMSNTPRFVVY